VILRHTPISIGCLFVLSDRSERLHDYVQVRMRHVRVAQVFHAWGGRVAAGRRARQLQRRADRCAARLRGTRVTDAFNAWWG
jgi:hypothetical protein